MKDDMTDEERIACLERLLADYVLRYGALPEATRYFVDMSRTNASRAAEKRQYSPK